MLSLGANPFPKGMDIEKCKVALNSQDRIVKRSERVALVVSAVGLISIIGAGVSILALVLIRYPHSETPWYLHPRTPWNPTNALCSFAGASALILAVIFFAGKKSVDERAKFDLMHRICDQNNFLIETLDNPVPSQFKEEETSF